MKSRNLLILALVVAAVAAYIAFYERHQMTTEERNERADKVFPKLDRDEVNRVEIDNPHGHFVVEKAGDAWQIVEPIDFAANTGAVNSLLSSLQNLEADRTLSTAEVELETYGLAEPEISVELTTDTGDSFKLAVGDEAALGSDRALRRDDENLIVLAPGWFVTDLDKKLDDWRSRDVVDVVASDVASIQVVAGDDRMQAVRNGRRWNLLQPIEDLADADHVTGLISDLNGLQIVEFLDEGGDLGELGLEHPAYDVTIVRSGDGAPIRLEFGATEEQDGATRVACRRDGSDLFWVSDGAAIRLAKAPILWRSRQVYDFETWDAEALTLTAHDQTVSLSRDQGLWTSADGAEVDHTAVQELLRSLSELEAIEFDLIQPATDVLGTVRLTVQPTDSDDVEDIEYTFYRPLAEGGQAMVVVNRRDTVMSVDAEAVDEILGDPTALLKPEQVAEPEPEE